MSGSRSFANAGKSLSDSLYSWEQASDQSRDDRSSRKPDRRARSRFIVLSRCRVASIGGRALRGQVDQGLEDALGWDRSVMPRPSGRRPGESGTRQAIVAAACKQFAELGYDRTSVRSVAREADVDPALVSYFFGSKLELFAVVVEPSEDVQDRLRAVFVGDREHLGQRFACFVVDELEDPRGRERLIALIRAASSEPAAAQKVREDFIASHIPVMVGSREDGRAGLGAVLVSAQVIGIVLGRYVFGLEPLASALPAEIVDAIAPALQGYLAPPT
jgi:AcrR family transcriptional regulator